ncbi:MAG: DUF1826 domain-containing protein [Pseudomonadota bacterium]
MSAVMALAPAARVGADADVMAALARPDCAAAVWDRAAPDGVTAWLDGLEADLLPRGRVVVRPDDVAWAVGDMCNTAGTPEGPVREAFVADVAALADRFAAQMDAAWLRVRLDVVTTNACRKFHIDALRARLVCTYRGTGTQYGMAAPRTEPAQVHTVPTGAPILLRGTLWPAPEAGSLLHRSPPIEGTGEVRLVLVLDPMERGEDDI